LINSSGVYVVFSVTHGSVYS